MKEHSDNTQNEQHTDRAETPRGGVNQNRNHRRDAL